MKSRGKLTEEKTKDRIRYILSFSFSLSLSLFRSFSFSFQFSLPLSRLDQNDDKAYFFLLTMNCRRLDIGVECEILPRAHLNDSAKTKLKKDKGRRREGGKEGEGREEVRE